MKRERWLDCVKGFAILLVIMGHIGASEGIVQNWIYSFHMALFFCVTGYLSGIKEEKSKFFDFTLKKTKQLLWPYMTYGLLEIVYLAVLRQFSEIENVVWQTVTLQGYSVLWFLFTMFFAQIIYYFYSRMKYLFQGIISFILMILTSVISWNNYQNSYINGESVMYNDIWNVINRIMIAVVFLWVGSLINKLICYLEIGRKKVIMTYLCVAVFFANMYLVSAD